MYEDVQMRSIACRALALSLPKRPVFLDIGAAGGLTDVWRYLARMGVVGAYGFDPNAGECDRLAAQYPFIKFLPVALGARREVGTFYETLAPAVCSFREPNAEFLKDYPSGGTFKVLRTHQVQLVSLDELVASGAVEPPDFLKIDTQGFELEVLKGAEAALRSVVGIELEAQFRPLYKGQALFGEIHAWLYERGFILRDLQQNPYAAYEGELIEVNAFFSRPYTDDQAVIKRLKIWEFAALVSSPAFAAQEKLRHRTMEATDAGLTAAHFNRLLGEVV